MAWATKDTGRLGVEIGTLVQQSVDYNYWFGGVDYADALVSPFADDVLR